MPNVYFSISVGNNCVLVGEKIGLIRNILTINGDTILLIEWFREIVSFFTRPLQSSDLRIFKVRHQTDAISSVKVVDVTCKCVLLPQRDSFVAFPLIHDLHLNNF